MNHRYRHSIVVDQLIYEYWAPTHRASLDVSPLPIDCHHLVFNLGVPRLLLGAPTRVLNTGEAIILDEPSFRRFVLGRSLGLAHWYLPSAWLLARVDSTRRLLGYPLREPCKWCVALNAFLAQLTPELLVDGPITPTAVAGQIGTLLALIAEGDVRGHSLRKQHVDMRDRVWMRLIEQCANTELAVIHVAQSLGISVRTLQRALALDGENFSDLLFAARIQLATRMLESPNLRKISVAEVGRRVGFKDPSHFTKVFRRLRGMSPVAARRLACDRQPEP